MKHFKLLFLLLNISILTWSQSTELKSISRLDYYTNEERCEILVFGNEFHSSGWKLGEYSSNMIEPKVITEKGLIRILFTPVDMKMGNNLVNIMLIKESKKIPINTSIKWLPHKKNIVQIDRYYGCIVSDKQKEVPFGFYAYSPVQNTLAEEEVCRGFTMMSPYQKIADETLEDRRAYMDRCAQLGMKVHYQLLSVAGGGGVGAARHKDVSDEKKRELLIKEINEFKNHPALLAWYISDEPVGQNKPVEPLEEMYKTVKELDPYHPVTMVFMTPNKAKDYRNAMDIVMADPYPVPHNPLTEVSDVCKLLENDFKFEKAVWVVPQAFGGNEWWEREPTRSEIRCMTYLALINGGTGIQYFIRHGHNSFPKSASTWAECGAIATELMHLEPFLVDYEYKVPLECSNKNLQYKAWFRDEQIMVAVINTKNEPQEFEMYINHNKLSTNYKAIFEDRVIKHREGNFRDMIDCYGTRVYIMDLHEKENKTNDNLLRNPDFENFSSAGVPQSCYFKVGKDRGATNFLSTKDVISGNYAVKITNPSHGEGVNQSFFRCKLWPNYSYTYSVMAKKGKSPKIDSIQYARLSWLRRIFKRGPKDKSNQISLSLAAKNDKFELNNEWRKYELHIPIKTGSKPEHYSPNIKYLGEGEMFLDKMSLIQDIHIHDTSYSGKIQISLSSPHKDVQILYRTKTKNEYKTYNKAFYIENNAILEVILKKGNKQVGSARKSYKVHKATGCEVIYSKIYAKAYSAGGKSGLVNGITGTTKFKDGNWQGFIGKAPEIVIDLGKAIEISKISTAFLHDQNVWIFTPQNVSVSFSMDNQKYINHKDYTTQTNEKSIKAEREIVSFEFTNQKARYIKISMKNSGLCPEWHKGKGKASWLFIDEIIVE
jgi:hypothetical protein